MKWTTSNKTRPVTNKTFLYTNVGYGSGIGYLGGIVRSFAKILNKIKNLSVYFISLDFNVLMRPSSSKCWFLVPRWQLTVSLDCFLRPEKCFVVFSLFRLLPVSLWILEAKLWVPRLFGNNKYILKPTGRTVHVKIFVISRYGKLSSA